MHVLTPSGNTIIRTEQRDYQVGCVTVIAQAGAYKAQGPCYEFQLPEKFKPAEVDALIAASLASDAEAEKIAAIDAALDAEYAKRKDAVDYDKGAVDAMAEVFPTTVEASK